MSMLYRGCIVSFLFIAICLQTASHPPPAAAGQLGDIPVIKEFAAGMRAIAAMDPDEKIRNPDTMAKQLLSPAFWFWTALDEDYDHSKKFITYYRVSSYFTFNACTKHIDGILQSAADKRMKQVVIIGAGLDSRAYRFGKRMPGVRFFEVDQPRAAARKQELVKAAVGRLPDAVTYVPVDYFTGEIGPALKRAGYNRQAKSLFIWEGLTPYTAPAAVDKTLNFIAQNAAPGSELVFDYIWDDIARGDFSKMPWARFQFVRMTAYGFPWKFGIAPDKAAAFVSDRGLGVLSDWDAGQLARQYLVRSDGSIDGKPAPYFRMMHAVVKK